MPKSKEPTVQPIESVDEAPEKIPVTDKSTELCWNCKAQDPNTKNLLDLDGNCEVCGFEKDKLYNGQLEADRIAQRVEAQRQAESEAVSKRTAELMRR